MRPPPSEPSADDSAPRTVVGLQPVRECIRAHGRGVRRLVLSQGPSPKLTALERFARDSGVERVERAPRATLDRLSRGVHHQGAVAYAPELSLCELPQLLEDPTLLAVALDRVQDPQNFGAVVRSAVAAAGAAVIWGENASAPLTPATFRASAGAVEQARLCRVPSLSSALIDARASGIQIVGLAAHATGRLWGLDLTRPTVIVVGSEGRGLQSSVKRACEHQVALVDTRTLDSLNASVAAAIALYEAHRQRVISTA